MHLVYGTLLGALALGAAAAPASAQVAAIKASQAHHASALAPHRNEVSVTANIQDLSEGGSEQAYSVKLSRKVSMRTTLFGSVTPHKNFDVDDAQIQVGVTHAISRRALVTAAFTQGIGAEIVAGSAVDLKLAGVVSPHLRPFVEYNFSRYKETTVPGLPPGEIDKNTITAGAEFPFDAKTSLSAAYQLSSASDRDATHGITAFITHSPTSRLSLNAGGTYATAERLILVSKYAFRRHLVTSGFSGGFTWGMSSRTSLDFTYEFQRVRGVEYIHKFAPVITWKF